MTEEKEQMNPYDYAYEKDQVWMIDATACLMMIDFMNEVIESQPNIGALLVYPKTTEEIKDKEGKVVGVNIEWADHNANSFFTTASQENGSVPFMTALAYKAEQIKQSLGLIHAQNIQKGVAKKLTELKQQDGLSNIS